MIETHRRQNHETSLGSLIKENDMGGTFCDIF